jgi:N6-L-threonylcarbamoyladenine synthase
MTLVLALDTSTEEVALGLGRFGEAGTHLLAETNLDVPRASLTHLAPSITRLLDSADLEISAVDVVVVGRGPGSFTGVRIAVAAAKGIAQGLGVPLFGVGTLDAVAERFAGRDGLLGVVGDAMRKEVYPALFQCSGGSVSRLTPDAVAFPASVAQQWQALDVPIMLAGNGLRKHAAVFEDALGARAEFAPEPLWTPSGEALLQAAWRARRDGTLGDGSVATLLPVYTRLSDAEENERARTAGGATPASGVAGPAEGASR